MAPLLLLMKGHPGVGKSALARWAGNSHSFALVEKSALQVPSAGSVHSAAANNQAFAADQAPALHGVHAIADATCVCAAHAWMLCRRLAQRLHCALVDKDDVRDCFQVGPHAMHLPNCAQGIRDVPCCVKQ